MVKDQCLTGIVDQIHMHRVDSQESVTISRTGVFFCV